MDVYYMNIDSKVYDYNYKYYINEVSCSKKSYIDSLKFYKDKKESLYGEIIVKLLLSRRYKLRSEEISFTINENGKKYINNRKDIFFNLSHSNNNIVCCIDNREVGIDIEFIKNPQFGIAKRFFTESEIKYLQEANKSKINERFFKVFTRKEAYAKARGLRLFDVLSTYDTINKYKSNDIEHCSYSYSYSNNVISLCKLDVLFDEVITFYEVKINHKKEVIIIEKDNKDFILI